MFNKLTQAIEKLLSTQPHVVVGISGFGGAGKTTLANKLRDYFEIGDSQVVRLDNIFAENHRGKPIFEDYDWPVITKLLHDVHNGEKLKYQGRGFYGEQLDFDELLPKVIIVEGVRLFRPESIACFDISVWIDCSPELATKRGEQRDRDSGADEQHVKRWRTEWLPKDVNYLSTYRPIKIVNFIYKE